MSALDVSCRNCIARLYEGDNVVLTVGNDTGRHVDVETTIPVGAAILLDRVDGTRVPLAGGKFSFKLKPYEFRAFELRP